MRASILDLRYKMKDVLLAIDRNEVVNILYHGKVKGMIIPAKKELPKDITTHPFFGMCVNDKKNVQKTMEELRGGRFDAI